MKRRVVTGLLVVMALAALPQLVAAQTFPGKPVKFIVPFPAGGINDILARILSDKLQTKWGQPIVIENVSVSPESPLSRMVTVKKTASRSTCPCPVNVTSLRDAS